MDAIFHLFKDESFRLWYTAGIFVLLLLPLPVAWWHRSRMKRTPGGRAVLARQKAIGPYAHRYGDASRLVDDIKRGIHGPDARAQHLRVTRFLVLWIAAVTLAAGLMIWADEANRVLAP
jgi:hypothetical protein